MDEESSKEIVEKISQIAYDIRHMKRIMSAVAFRLLDKQNQEVVMHAGLSVMQDENPNLDEQNQNIDSMTESEVAQDDVLCHTLHVGNWVFEWANKP